MAEYDIPELAKTVGMLTLMMEKIMERIPPQSPTAGTSQAPHHEVPTSKFPSVVELASAMDTFVYNKDKGVYFSAWYERYATVFQNAAHLGDQGKVQLLLMKLDTAHNKVFHDSIYPKKNSEITFEEAKAKLEVLFSVNESLFRKRFNALQIRRSPNEDVPTYAAKVNRFAEDFQAASFGAEQLKCLLFVLGFDGVADREVRTRLLNLMETKDTVTLTEMMAESTRLINVKADTTLGSSSTSSGAIHKVTHHGNNSSKSSHGKQRPKGKNTPAVHLEKHPHSKKTPRSPCWGCGRMHMYADCEYKGKTCPDCNRPGHKSGYCAAFRTCNPNSANVNIVKTERKLDDESAAANQLIVNRKFLEVFVNKVKTTFQLDTAADLAIVSEATWKSWGSPTLSKPSVEIRDAQAGVIQVNGELQSCDIEFDGQLRQGRCLVANIQSNLFGIEWIDLFGLWSKPPALFCKSVKEQSITEQQVEVIVGEIKSSWPVVFSSSMGCCDKVKPKLFLRPDCRDVFRKKRPVPFHSVPAVVAELDRLQEAGIITPVDRSQFAAPIVVVQKANGTIRICGDYSTGLNDSLEQHEYPIPTPEDIFASLSGCQWFSQIDLSDAYLQLQVDEDSSKLLTINTIKGLYKFNRLCPGVRPAAAIFQQTMDTMLAGIEFVIVYFDDILIATPSIEQHTATLKAVFGKLAEWNMRVRINKCNFFKNEVKYLGIIVDREGQRPDPEKLKAIETMPAPANAPQLRSYLGAITFYSRFIRDLAAIRHPLNQLLKQGVDFTWDRSCNEAFIRFKEILVSDLLLTHFNPGLQIVVAADASQTGIGGVAYHTFPDGSMKAFLHVSRRLTPAESRYSQIELEALAIVWSVTKFHKYIFGRRFLLYTDHRPLLALFGSNKGIPMHVANRIQRWAIILMAYDFEMQYIRTEDFGHADILSRLIADHRTGADDELVIAEVQICQLFVNLVDSALPVSFKHIVAATEDDQILPAVMNYVRNGWPAQQKFIESPPVAAFFRFRESLSVVDGALTYMDRTIIPLALQSRVLEQLHQAHPGETRMKSLARCYVYWPGIDEQIINVVRSCGQCQAAGKMPPKQELSSWALPTAPWERVHIDYAMLHQRNYLLIVDAFSKWPEILPMSSTTSAATIKALRTINGRFGNMVTLVSDNAPSFMSEEFASFCRGEGINHITTPIFHPQSNGQVERLVDTFKRNMNKQQSDSEEDLQRFLQHYRATPCPSVPGGTSPAEVMLGRKIRLGLNSVLPPPPKSIVKNQQMEKQFNQKHGAKKRSFEAGEEVLVKLTADHATLGGTIVERVGRVMFNVLADGRLLRIHINQLLPAPIVPDEFYIVEEPVPKEDTVEQQPRRRANPRAVTRRSPPVLRPRPIAQRN